MCNWAHALRSLKFVQMWTRVQSCRPLCDPMDYRPPAPRVHSFLGKNTGVGCRFLLRGSSHPRDSTHVSCISCLGRWILYHWCHQCVNICCSPFIKYSKNTVIIRGVEFYFLTFCFNEHMQKHMRIFQIHKAENRG